MKGTREREWPVGGDSVEVSGSVGLRAADVDGAIGRAGVLSPECRPDKVYGGEQVAARTWVHVPVTRRSSQVTFYLNGQVSGVSRNDRYVVEVERQSTNRPRW